MNWWERFITDSADEEWHGPQLAARSVMFIVGLVLLVGRVVVACKPVPPVVVQNVENAAAVAQYEALLDDCRRQGRAANSYRVYETCANAVDDKLCAEHKLRCPEDR